MNDTLEISGDSLTIEQVVKVAKHRTRIRLAEMAKNKILKSRKEVDKIVANNEVVYGITTGFGSLSNVSISKDDVEKLQENLIMSHAVGVGEPFNEETVRAIMLLRVNTFAKGHSGVRIDTVNMLIDMINRDIYPHVPSQGSVGSSGDLAPLSHIILVMLGKGEAFVDGKKVSGKLALKKANLKPVILKAKEGLALNNGTPVMTAVGLLAINDAENLLRHSILCNALSLEALKANTSFLFEGIQKARPHEGQAYVAQKLKEILKGSTLIDSNKEKVQDAYSLRASAVVQGASRDAIMYVKKTIEVEINSATDNPLIFDGKAYSGANFHGQPIALAMDFLGIAVSELANISERRISRILDPCLNEGLPAFLVNNPGINSGFMITQYTAAALVSENKVFSHPASVDSIPTCANQEDHVSMGTNAARKARTIIDNATKVISIELMIAAQAVEMRDTTPADTTKLLIQEIRKEVDRLYDDRVIYHDINKLTDMIEKRYLLNKMVSVVQW